MYANLMVRLADGEVLYAWKVEPGDAADGLVVHLDNTEDESSYPAPAGERNVALAELEQITADF